MATNAPFWSHPSTASLTEVVKRRVLAHLAGNLTEAPATLASTVLLLRDHPAHGLQVLLQRRASMLAFAPGAEVFPGGGVERGDREAPGVWRGPSPESWASALGLGSPADATGVLRAAVRETYEECGVRLQEPGELDTTRLTHWSTWVTPAWSPRRYWTTFLAARAPSGEVARTASSESTSTRWVSPRHIDGTTARLMLPTRATLQELAEHDSVAEALARPATTVPRQIRSTVVGGQVLLTLDTSEGTVTKDRYLCAAR